MTDCNLLYNTIYLKPRKKMFNSTMKFICIIIMCIILLGIFYMFFIVPAVVQVQQDDGKYSVHNN
jgi:hypothetical protein